MTGARCLVRPGDDTVIELSIAEQELINANRIQAAAALKVALLRCSAVQGRDAPLLSTGRSPDISPAAAEAPHIWIGSAESIGDRALVFVVDHDAQVRSALCRLLESNGLHAEAFADGSAFLGAYHRRDNACLLADTALSDLGGFRCCRNWVRMPTPCQSS